MYTHTQMYIHTHTYISIHIYINEHTNTFFAFFAFFRGGKSHPLQGMIFCQLLSGDAKQQMCVFKWVSVGSTVTADWWMNGWLVQPLSGLINRQWRDGAEHLGLVCALIVLALSLRYNSHSVTKKKQRNTPGDPGCFSRVDVKIFTASWHVWTNTTFVPAVLSVWSFCWMNLQLFTFYSAK